MSLRGQRSVQSYEIIWNDSCDTKSTKFALKLQQRWWPNMEITLNFRPTVLTTSTVYYKLKVYTQFIAEEKFFLQLKSNVRTRSLLFLYIHIVHILIDIVFWLITLCIISGDISKLKKSPFIIKEGCQYRVKIYFYVQRELVSGLKYVQKSHKAGIKGMTDVNIPISLIG